MQEDFKRSLYVLYQGLKKTKTTSDTEFQHMVEEVLNSVEPEMSKATLRVLIGDLKMLTEHIEFTAHIKTHLALIADALLSAPSERIFRMLAHELRLLSSLSLGHEKEVERIVKELELESQSNK